MTSLPPEHSDQVSVLQSLAEQIVKRRLTVPAIFLFELYKPLLTMTVEMGRLAGGMLQPLLATSRYQKFLDALSTREQVETLIQLLEQGEREVGDVH